MQTLLRTPLYAAHQKMGGKIVDFAGWEMPVQYSSIIAESDAVRKGAGMFDVSHMGRTWFRGERALEFLELITTNDVSKLEDGGSQYSMMCYENGTCVDDIIVYRIKSDVFRVVINASNREKDIAWMLSHNNFGVEFTDETLETTMIAVQGPKAVETVNSLADRDMTSVPKFFTAECGIVGVPAFCARTGYTGEDGYELIIPASGAEKVWNALAENGVAPCGLASRDVLRVEAGLPLYGHELTDGFNPLEAGLGWVISKTKTFLGSEKMTAMRATGIPRKLIGIKMASKLVPREGYEIQKAGRKIGEVSSGVYSPLLQCGIAFAFVGKDDGELDVPCEVIVREKPQPATIVSKRFLQNA